MDYVMSEKAEMDQLFYSRVYDLTLGIFPH